MKTEQKSKIFVFFKKWYFYLAIFLWNFRQFLKLIQNKVSFGEWIGILLADIFFITIIFIAGSFIISKIKKRKNENKN